MSFNFPMIHNIPGNVFVASAVLLLRTVFDYIFETKSISETLKKIHIDLLWMGLVLWGVFLFDLETNNILLNLIGGNPQPRLFIFCFLLCVLVGATKLKKVEAAMSLQRKTWREHTQIIGMTLFLHALAFINLGTSLVLGQLTNNP